MLYSSPSMKRRLVAAAWIAGAIVPMVMGALLLVGCCVLPFHGVMHRLMPLCETAAKIVRGDPGGHEHEQQPAAPAREKQEPLKRIASEMPDAFRMIPAAGARIHADPVAATGYRSFISHGAIRCDHDVGLYVLADTFRI